MELDLPTLEPGYAPARWSFVALAFALLMWRARGRVRWQTAVVQVGVVVAAYFAYFGVRGLTEGSAAQAVTNAASVVELERALGFYWEPELNAAITDRHALMTLANWVYIWGHWPVIVVAATWLLVSHPETFRVTRNAFLISGAIGLVIFTIFPVAPPRLTDAAFVDTVTLHSDAYRVLQPPALVNQYAAVPSLHFGWNLLIGIALVQCGQRRSVKLLGWVLPALMGVAIVVTANHWIFDAFAGAAVALAGLLIARRAPHQPRPSLPVPAGR